LIQTERLAEVEIRTAAGSSSRSILKEDLSDVKAAAGKKEICQLKLEGRRRCCFVFVVFDLTRQRGTATCKPHDVIRGLWRNVTATLGLNTVGLILVPLDVVVSLPSISSVK